jgi:hypothetical protein
MIGAPPLTGLSFPDILSYGAKTPKATVSWKHNVHEVSSNTYQCTESDFDTLRGAPTYQLRLEMGLRIRSGYESKRTSVRKPGLESTGPVIKTIPAQCRHT